MITSTRLGLTIWNLGSDPYNHLELAANWQALDDAVLKRTGDTATGTMRVEVADTSTEAFGVKLVSDTNARVKLHADAIHLGDGAGTFDVKLYRGQANRLTSDDQIEVNYASDSSFLSSNGNSVALEGYKIATQSFIRNRLLSTDTQSAFRILGSGEINLGPGGSTPTDTRIFRSAAATVQIVDNLKVANLEATNSVTINGVVLNVSGGNIQSSSSLITSNIVRARDGFTGRLQLGDSSDNTRSIIFFGGSSDVNLYRDGADILRTDDALTVGGKLQVNSTITASIETEGGIDVAGPSQLTGNVNITGTLTAQSTLTLVGGAGVSGRTPIGTTYLLGNLFRGKQLWLESSTNSNLWYFNNNASVLELRTTTYSGTGAGTSDTLRLKIDTAGTYPHYTFYGELVSAYGANFNGGFVTADGYIANGGSGFSTNTGGVTAVALQINGNGTITGKLSTPWVTDLNYLEYTALDSFVFFRQKMRIVSNNPSSAAGTIVFFYDETAPGAQARIQSNYLVYAPGFVTTSDATLKTKAKKTSVLDKLGDMESLGQWRFTKTAAAKTELGLDPEEKHYGPTAQEFNEAFGLTPRNHGYEAINVADMAGVALIGLKELSERITQLEERLG